MNGARAGKGAEAAEAAVTFDRWEPRPACPPANGVIPSTARNPRASAKDRDSPVHLEPANPGITGDGSNPRNRAKPGDPDRPTSPHLQHPEPPAATPPPLFRSTLLDGHQRGPTQIIPSQPIRC